MTTPPTTLHDRLRAELDRRLAVARAATPAWANVGTVVEAGPDGVPFVGNDDYVVEHIALHDPADAIRRYLGELEVLERHAPEERNVEWWDAPETGYAPVCRSCGDAEPNEWNLPIGAAGVKPDGWVSAYVLAPCAEIRSLAGRLGVSVDG